MRLWKRFNGEPFMINPQIGILGLGLNPKRKKRGSKKMARRSSRAHMAYVRSFRRKGRKHSPKRHRRARRNPYPVAGIALNPRRRRRARRSMRSNPRRRHYRRNPSLMGFGLPPLQSVLYAGVGFVGVPMLEGTLSSFLPLSITANTIGKYAVRIASVLGLTWLGKMVVGRSAATMIGIGGGAYVLVTAVKEFAPGVIPGLSAYAQPTMLGAYVPSRGRNFSTMGAMPSIPRVTARSGANSRFNRF